MFTRGGDVMTTLGIGTFAPMVDYLKKRLEEFMIDRNGYWMNFNGNASKHSITEWKSFPGGSNNICRLVALIETNDIEDMKWFNKSGLFSIKGLFKEKECKLTCVNYYNSEAKYRKYGFRNSGKNSVIMEFVYSRIKQPIQKSL
jgi:hypothetical protein